MTKLKTSGGYHGLRSFQTATIIYDATYWFCERFLDSRSRMCDQMIQAARSGRQNIAEGSRAAAASSQTELRLVNVARSSLEELLLDFEDFLRHRHLKQWHPDSPEALAVRKVAGAPPKNLTDPTDQSDPSNRSDDYRASDEQRYALYAKWLDHDDPAIQANALLCIIHQANYLLDNQIATLEAQFVEEGGYSEKLATARLVERNRQKNRTDRTDQSDPSDPSDKIPPCPKCGKAMVLRTAHKGNQLGKQFWGCSAYPDCKGLLDV